MNQLDPRITVGAKIKWISGDKAEVVSIEGDSFTLKWEDERVMSGYANADLSENGGNVYVEATNG